MLPEKKSEKNLNRQTMKSTQILKEIVNFYILCRA